VPRMDVMDRQAFVIGVVVNERQARTHVPCSAHLPDEHLPVSPAPRIRILLRAGSVRLYSLSTRMRKRVRPDMVMYRSQSRR